MRIPIDREAGIPLYRQIEQHLRRSILSGQLAAGTRLPAIRTLADHLGVNRITVENAYATLEADGLVACKVGNGTYIQPQESNPNVPEANAENGLPLWQVELQDRYRASLGDMAIKHLSWAETNYAFPQQNLISFSGGAGDPLLFPVNDLRKSIQAIMQKDGITALKYGDPRGSLGFRNSIVHMLATQGLHATPDEILITSGSQQAVSLLVTLLLKPGDPVLIEEPTYNMALNILRALNLRIVTIPVDHEGMQVDRLEKLLQQYHPKLIYTVPTFHNPTGTCLSIPRRKLLLNLAERYNVPIIEDDFAADFRYSGQNQPSLKALDRNGQVIHVATFSKMLIPGLRVGYIVAKGPFNDLLVEWKRVNDLNSSMLIQQALEAYVTIGRYQAHLRRTGSAYHKRMLVMLRAIETYLPEDIELHPPEGGLFLWIKLPEGFSADDLLPLAYQEGVNYAVGSRYFIDPTDGTRFMRLNFAAQPLKLIEEGIRRLGQAIAHYRLIKQI